MYYFNVWFSFGSWEFGERRSMRLIADSWQDALQKFQTKEPAASIAYIVQL